MLNIVGCAPSSGSTLFADLLDSSRYSACGEEINIFAVKKLYDFENFKRNIQKRSISSIYLFSEGINTDVLHHYGLNISLLNDIIRRSSTLREFSDLFSEHYLALRGKRDDGVLFEKTPQNILCIKEFLEHFPNSYFIFMVRNPILVFNSMRKRGFSKYISLITWYFETAKFYKFRDHNRVLVVRYEDLVKKPYTLTKETIYKTSNIRVSESEIEEVFRNNRYRKLYSIRLKSWDVKSVGDIVDANKKVVQKEYLEEFTEVFSAMINPRYASLFNMEKVSFTDLLHYFNYYDEVVEKTGSINSWDRKPKGSMSDHFRLFLRWAIAFRWGEARIRDLFTFMNPLL
jgi:hypothetical protein